MKRMQQQFSRAGAQGCRHKGDSICSINHSG
jgi:hypothetical protein